MIATAGLGILPYSCRRLGGVLMVALLAGAAAAGAELVAEWNHRFDTGVKLLEAGEAAKALRKFDGVLEEYVELAGTGWRNERTLGTMLAYKAIAEQMLGRVEDARWDWDLAANFLSESENLDLTRFGDAGQALLDYSAGPPKAESLEAQGADGGPCTKCEITPPKVIRRARPRYTVGAKQFLAEGALVVQVVVDAEGVVSRPRVVQKLSSPALSYQTLNVLRKWSFEPARLDGRPVATYYNLTVNYHLQ